MEIKTFDILLLFILAITVALIIGINVIYVVDKKLSDIKINVPPCPTPNVYIRSPSGLLSKVQVEHVNRSDIKRKLEKNKPYGMQSHSSKNTSNTTPITISKNVPNTTSSSKVTQHNVISDPLIHIAKGQTIHSHTDNRRINNNRIQNNTNQNNAYSTPIEGFNSVDKNKGHMEKNPIPLVVNNGNSLETMLLRQGYNSSGADAPNTGNNITYPDSSDIVRYNQPGCYKNLNTNGIRKISATQSKQPSCNSTLKEGQVNNIKNGFMTASGQIINQNIDLYIPRTYMGVNPHIRGPSYADMSLEQPADIDQIGSIPVNDYDGNPRPVNSFIVY